MAVLKFGDFAGVSDNGIQFLLDLATELNNLKTAINQLITDHNAHVHGGITAGAANSGAPTANTTATSGATTDTTDPFAGGTL